MSREAVEATPRKAMTPARRRRVRERQGDLCACDGCVELWVDVDHVVPLELGGADDDENLEGLCKAHHKEKTKADAKRIAKARRLRKREAGEKRRRGREIKSNPKIRSAGFRGWRSMSGETRWRKTKD